MDEETRAMIGRLAQANEKSQRLMANFRQLQEEAAEAMAKLSAVRRSIDENKRQPRSKPPPSE